MNLVKGAAVAAGLMMASMFGGNAVAAPISHGGAVGAPAQVDLVQNHHRNRWHGPRYQRCWWENRRVRDHRGRWVVRRVQVCRR